MALEEKDKIKDLFSSKLKDLEADVPSSIWAGIDQALSQQPIVAAKPTTRISLSRAMSVAASIVGTLIIATIALYVSRPNDSAQVASESFRNDMLKAKVVTIAEKSENENSVSSWEPITGEPEEGSSLHKSSQGQKIQRTVFSKLGSPSILLCDVQEQDRELGNIVTIRKPEKRKMLFADNIVSNSSRPVILPARKDDSRDMFLSLSSGSGVLASDVNAQSNMNIFASKGGSEVRETFSDQIVDLDHNQPISFSLLVNKQISSRISIETGLTYTYLSSRFKSKMYPEDVSGKTNFHYLGVPIHVNYNFLQLGKANFYVSLGGEIEKDIQGRLRWSVKNDVNASVNNIAEGNPTFMDSEVSNYSLFSERTNIHQDNLQFSAHMNLGASYPIYQKLYVYGTIGGAYYFNAKNEYPTIYSDKKVQLDLNLGLKWKF